MGDGRSRLISSVSTIFEEALHTVKIRWAVLGVPSAEGVATYVRAIPMSFSGDGSEGAEAQAR